MRKRKLPPGTPAGRPKANHTLMTEAFRKYVIERVIAEQGPLMDALLARAKKNSDKALDMALERVLGRPVTPLEHSGEGLEQLTNAIMTLLGVDPKKKQKGQEETETDE